MFKIIIWLSLSLYITSSFAFGSPMKLRCFDIFAVNTNIKSKVSALYYAEALDFMNLKYNGFLFKQSALDQLTIKNKDLDIFDNLKARYQVRKLKKVLVQLHDLDLNVHTKNKINIYNLEKIATQIEKLSFIMDDSQTLNMSRSEIITFKQIQHSLLTHGLAEFLFSDSFRSIATQDKTIRSKILAPFKKVYLRWMLSPVMMPQLDGAVIPYAVIEQVVWNGLSHSQDLLAPYLRTAQRKYAFNVFSATYNFIFTGLVVVGATQWLYTTTTESLAAYDRGVVNAEAMLRPALENAQALAGKDLSQEFKVDTLQISIEKFRVKLEREPTDLEVEMLKELIKVREQPRQ